MRNILSDAGIYILLGLAALPLLAILLPFGLIGLLLRPRMQDRYQPRYPFGRRAC